MAVQTDVRGALAAGIAAIRAWEQSELGRIAAAKASALGADPAVASLSAEFASLAVDEPLPQRFQGGQNLILHTHHGSNNLRMLDGDNKLEMHPNTGAWEQWQLQPAATPGAFYISSVGHDTRLTAWDDKKSIRPSKNRDKWEEWTLIDVGGGKFAFRSFHGTQLTVDDHGHVAQTPNRDAWEFFRIEIVGGGKAARKPDVERRLNEARAKAAAAAGAAEASQHAALAAEVQRRIAAKNDAANRIQAELNALANL